MPPLSSSSSMKFTAAPFANVKVFLHIRERSGNLNDDSTRHYAKKALRTLGGSLVTSENAADIIVFYCGNESFLENATARGKVIVTPTYLQECARRQERLPVEGYIVYPGASYVKEEVKNKTTTKRTLQGSDNNNNNGQYESVMQREKSNKKTKKEKDEGGENTETLMVLSTVPYLNDIMVEKIDEEKKEVVNMGNTESFFHNSKTLNYIEPTLTTSTATLTTMSSSVLNEGDQKDITHTLQDKTFGKTRNTQLFLSDDNNVDCSSSDKCSLSAGVFEIPTEEVNMYKHISIEQTTNDSDMRKEHCSVHSGGLLRKLGVNASIDKKSKLSVREVSVKNVKVSSNVTVTSQCKHIHNDTTNDDNNDHITEILNKKRKITQKQKQTTVNKKNKTTQSTVTDVIKTRVAVSGDNEGVIQFLSDVIEQLGGIYIPRVYGRVHKPTHLVIEGGGELTLMVLLARALGIPILTSKWLYDAIVLGTFPKNISTYFHPVYSTNINITRNKEEKISSYIHSDLLRKDIDIEDSFIDIFKQDLGPYYKPIFLGKSFVLVSHLSFTYISQFMELIRVLGGSVFRSPLSLNLSVIIDLGYGMIASEYVDNDNDDDKEKEEKNSIDKRRKKKKKKVIGKTEEKDDEDEDEMMVETQSISLTYTTKLNEGKNITFHPSHDILHCVMTERFRHNLPCVPVVSVEWIIQCILLGEVTEMTPFKIPVTLDETSEYVKREQRCHGDNNINNNNNNSDDDDGDGDGIELTSLGQKMLCNEVDKTPEFSSSPVVNLRRLPFVFSPLAKTSEGPRSAIKHADQQLTTQELLFSVDSDDD